MSRCRPNRRRFARRQAVQPALRQVDAGAAADLQHLLSAHPLERHEAQQVMQLFEVILIEIVKESTRPDRVRRDLEIVNVLFPVAADVVDGGHAAPLYYSHP